MIRPSPPPPPAASSRGRLALGAAWLVLSLGACVSKGDTILNGKGSGAGQAGDEPARGGVMVGYVGIRRVRLVARDGDSGL